MTFGDNRQGAPPVPIPNTAVKALAADGSKTQCLVRVGYCQIMARFSERRAGPLFCPYEFRGSNGDSGRRLPWNCTRWYTMPFNGHSFLSFACRFAPCNIAELGETVFRCDFHIATSSRASKRPRTPCCVGGVLCGRRHSFSPISMNKFQ